MTDLISRADAIEAVCGDCTFENRETCERDGYCYEVRNLMALPSAEAVEVKAEQLPPKVPTEWINDGMVLVPQHDWIEMQKKLEEYVSAEAEFADLPDIPRHYYEKVVGNMAHEINMLKEQLESADAVQGEWVRHELWGNPWFTCSECNYHGRNDFNFCPNCGARMKGGAE